MTRSKISPLRGITARMKTPGTSRTRRRRSGSTLVEFAMVLPILLLLSMLLVQYGIILNTTISLINLAREGSRYAAVNPTPTSAIQDNIEGKTPPGITLTDSDITVTCSTTQCTTSSDIKVTIKYNMKKKMFLPTKFFNVNVFGSGTYTTSSTMRVE